jgi:hypothetical protein
MEKPESSTVYLEKNVYPTLLKGMETLLSALKSSDGTFNLEHDTMLHPVTWLALYLHQEARNSKKS